MLTVDKQWGNKVSLNPVMLLNFLEAKYSSSDSIHIRGKTVFWKPNLGDCKLTFEVKREFLGGSHGGSPVNEPN